MGQQLASQLDYRVSLCLLYRTTYTTMKDWHKLSAGEYLNMHTGRVVTFDLRQHYVLNQDPNAVRVLEWIQAHDLDHDIHLNRIRFWVPLDSTVYTEFALRFATVCPIVEELLDAD
jgi:hypothetical protein